MKKFEVKENTHLVIKVEDALKYLTGNQNQIMESLLTKIDNSRLNDGKKLNNYLVVNRDEPYAKKVFKVIKRGEKKKLKEESK